MRLADPAPAQPDNAPGDTPSQTRRATITAGVPGEDIIRFFEIFVVSSRG